MQPVQRQRRRAEALIQVLRTLASVCYDLITSSERSSLWVFRYRLHSITSLRVLEPLSFTASEPHQSLLHWGV